MNSKFSKIFINILKLWSLIFFVYPSEEFKISNFGFALYIANFLVNIIYYSNILLNIFQHKYLPTRIMNRLFQSYIAYQSVVKMLSWLIILFSQKRIFKMLIKVENFGMKSRKINSKISSNFHILLIILTTDIVLKNFMHRDLIGSLFYILFDAPIYFYLFMVYIITHHIENIENFLRYQNYVQNYSN